MNRKSIFASISGLLLLGVLAAPTWAAEGNARKGKHLFRNSCRQCHQEDGEATPLGPDSKTQAQWERAFRPENYQQYQCKDTWAEMPQEDLEDIFTYLHKHAFDSPSPAKCK